METKNKKTQPKKESFFRSPKKIIISLILLLLLLPLTIAGVQHTQTIKQHAQSTNSVTISNFQFSPRSITIPVGTTVTWRNNGPSTHTTTADAGSWNSGNLTVGQTFSRTFTAAGTFQYHCNIHNSMTGTVTVTGATAATNPPPLPTTIRPSTPAPNTRNPVPSPGCIGACPTKTPTHTITNTPNQPSQTNSRPTDTNHPTPNHPKPSEPGTGRVGSDLIQLIIEFLTSLIQFLESLINNGR